MQRYGKQGTYKTKEKRQTSDRNKIKEMEREKKQVFQFPSAARGTLLPCRIDVTVNSTGSYALEKLVIAAAAAATTRYAATRPQEQALRRGDRTAARETDNKKRSQSPGSELQDILRGCRVLGG